MVMKYPSALTNREWQKNKGLFAKAKPTGIGEKLTAVEKAFSASYLPKADAKAIGGGETDPILYERRLATFDKNLKLQLAKINAALGDADKTIRLAMPKFANNGSVHRYLDSLTKVIKVFKADIDPAGTYIKQLHADIDKAFRANLAKCPAAVYTKGHIAATAEQKWKTLTGMVKQLEATPTIAKVHELFGQDGPHRLMTTNAKMWDQLFVRDFPELTKSIYPGKAMNDYAALPWMMEVADEAGSTASKKLTQLAQKSSEERAVTTMALEYSRSLVSFHALNDHLKAVEKALAKWL